MFGLFDWIYFAYNLSCDSFAICGLVSALLICCVVSVVTLCYEFDFADFICICVHCFGICVDCCLFAIYLGLSEGFVALFLNLWFSRCYRLSLFCGLFRIVPYDLDVLRVDLFCLVVACALLFVDVFVHLVFCVCVLLTCSIAEWICIALRRVCINC